MKWNALSQIVFLALCIGGVMSRTATAQFAAEVVSYDQGTTPAIEFGSGLPYNTSAAAIGSPARFINDSSFPSVVSPFSPPYLRDQIVSIGEGGELTLRLSNYALPLATAPQIGVFSNVGVVDPNYTGQAGSPATTFGTDSAKVEVSPDGVTWISLGKIAFDIPTNGYTDLANPYAGAPGSALTDFQQPFIGSLSDFSGLKYSNGGSDMLALLGGSGGGKWLDLTGTGLAKVGFIRFSVADDGNSNTKLHFELDGVSISHAALGGATVPEPASVVLVAELLMLLVGGGRRALLARARHNRHEL
jgi:hypothetical protein